MSTVFFERFVCVSFENFVVELPPEKLGDRSDRCLMDYVQAWVESGEGIRDCAGNFETYLLAVIAIINLWTERPEVLTYVPEDETSENIQRNVSSIFGGNGRFALDRHWFAQLAFAQRHR